MLCCQCLQMGASVLSSAVVTPPCFVLVFRKGPRGLQAGCEMKGGGPGGARVHHSPGLKVVHDARVLGCAHASAQLGCSLRIGRRGGGGWRGCVGSQGGARRSSPLTAME